MPREHEIRIDGMSVADVLSLPPDEISALILCHEPVVFRAGSAEIFGQFWTDAGTLVLELVQIEGGGEGVLPVLAALAHRFAARESLRRVEWRVHAVRCARPNPKLKDVLRRRGFAVKTIEGSGECYYLVELIDPDGHVRRPMPLLPTSDYVVDLLCGAAPEDRALRLRHPSSGSSVTRRIGAEPAERHLPELLLELARSLRPNARPA